MLSSISCSSLFITIYPAMALFKFLMFTLIFTNKLLCFSASWSRTVFIDCSYLIGNFDLILSISKGDSMVFSI